MRNILNTAHERWIEPEIQRRRDTGALPEDFRIRQCLIRLPVGAPPVVEFNDEIGWIAKVDPVEDLTAGEPVYLHQIGAIRSVEPPSIDGKRVAFYFLFW